MSAHEMKLVTIVCEALARDAVIRLLTAVGAHGFTCFEVEGVGSQGERTAEMREFANIQFEVIVRPEVCDKLMEQLETRFFATYSMIAFESDIRVRRKEKF